MTDEIDPTVIAESFRMLYVERGQPTISSADLARRYEFCEDLAQRLAESLTRLGFTQGHAYHEVLERWIAGLSFSELMVSPPEAGWVINRSAKVLDWDVPPAPSFNDG